MSTNDDTRPAGYTNRGGESPEAVRAKVADQTRAELAAFLRTDAGKRHPDAGFLAAAAGPAGVRARAVAEEMMRGG